MYAQYQNYQNSGGMAVATHQQGLTWNGKEWVQTGNVGSGMQSTHSSVINSQVNSQANYHVSTFSNNDEGPVFRYTKFYHGWKAKEAEEEKKAQTLQGNLKQEAVRNAAWAKYYADQASRAAHYYNNPQGPIPELPPEPPSSIKISTSSSLHSTGENQSQSRNKRKKPSPGSLKRYVHRCLERCKGKQEGELQWMQNEVQKVIGQALKDGTMHTIDWDLKALIPMQSEVSLVKEAPAVDGFPSHHNVQSKRSVKLNNESVSRGEYPIKNETMSINGNYNGKCEVSSSAASSYNNGTALDDKYSRKLPKNDSYYGRQVSTSTESVMCNVNQPAAKKQRRENQWVREKKTNSDAENEQKRTLTKNHTGFQKSDLVLNTRAKRFGEHFQNSKLSSQVETRNFDKYMGKSLIGGASKLNENDYERMTVKGTCQILEKEYLRLTAPPKAERVRPQFVLERHLQNLIKEREKTSTRRDYVWFCSQFKAIRQDLTVQRIFNHFTVLVYETHARIALQEMDLNEYNQCQTQLKELYVNLAGCSKAVVNQNEFVAYRLIYYVFLTGNKKYEGGSSDLFDIMLSLTPEQRNDIMIRYALKVRSAVADFNYHTFFHLQNNAPTSSMVFLMDYLVPSVRFWALQRICKAFRPSISIQFVLTELGFEKEDPELASKWLESCGCVLSENRQFLQTKDSVVHESDWKEQNSLI